MALSARSERNLRGVHPDLVKVVRLAASISTQPFEVIEGLRTAARQAELVKVGASRTLKSRHLTGHAVDLAALVSGTIRWDWPLYRRLAMEVKAAARDLGVAIVWGGDWKTFRDGPHFELARSDYP
ncbi:MAG: M15 family metallopeptidase [Burkholderiales bacterium]|nr:M15 family metallopeptidase [Burkholderiales bacterium]